MTKKTSKASHKKASAKTQYNIEYMNAFKAIYVVVLDDHNLI